MTHINKPGWQETHSFQKRLLKPFTVMFTIISESTVAGFRSYKRVWKNLFFLIGIHSMQSLTATARHRVTRKRNTQRLKHIGNLFRKNLQLKGVC